MCSINGIAFLNGHAVWNCELIKDLINDLLLEGMLSGRTATGIAYVNDEEINVIKRNFPASNFIKLPQHVEAMEKYVRFKANAVPLRSILLHCRLQTQGTHLDNKNNHPIVRENVVGIHNGCIVNDNSLFRMYSNAFERNGAVDSEIIFALIDHFVLQRLCENVHEAIRSMSRTVSGSFACAMVHRKYPHILWLFRRSNPCHIILYRDKGILVWSSNISYIQRATANKNLGPSTTISLGLNSGMAIDLKANKMHTFSLPTYVKTFASVGGFSL